MALVPYFYTERPLRAIDRKFMRPSFGCCSPHQLATRGFSPDHFPKPWKDMLRPWESIMKPMEQLSAAMNQMGLQDVGTKIMTDNEKFEVNVDVQHFAPEEISVKVTDGHIIVEGKHDEKIDEHGYVSRMFIRRYALPQDCLPDTVVSKLSSDGVLTVTAPKVIALPSSGERIVPIKHAGPVKKQLGSPCF